MSTYAEGMGVATGIAFDPPKIFMSAIVAGRFSRSARIDRFLFSPRSIPAYPPITWPSARAATCLSPAQRPPVSIPCTRSTPTAASHLLSWFRTSARTGVRYRRQSIRGGFALRQARHRRITPDAKASSRLPARDWLAWPSHPAVPRCWLLPAPSIIFRGECRERRWCRNSYQLSGSALSSQLCGRLRS